MSKKPTLNVVRIQNAVFYAYHGALEDEQNLGGKFELDVDMHCDFAAAAKTDSLEKTVDYQKVYAFIRETVLSRKYYLLETLAQTIARGILKSFPRVHIVHVRIRKPHPPVKGVVDFVEVEVKEAR
jgi:7,8-dihydroneopterin aldolase/epimerase/oxygenase